MRPVQALVRRPVRVLRLAQEPVLRREQLRALELARVPVLAPRPVPVHA